MIGFEADPVVGTAYVHLNERDNAVHRRTRQHSGPGYFINVDVYDDGTVAGVEILWAGLAESKDVRIIAEGAEAPDQEPVRPGL